VNAAMPTMLSTATTAIQSPILLPYCRYRGRCGATGIAGPAFAAAGCPTSSGAPARLVPRRRFPAMMYLFPFPKAPSNAPRGA